jgi:hypothetical protein
VSYRAKASEQSPSRGDADFNAVLLLKFLILYLKGIINSRFKGNINNLTVYCIYLIYSYGVVNGE